MTRNYHEGMSDHVGPSWRDILAAPFLIAFLVVCFIGLGFAWIAGTVGDIWTCDKIIDVYTRRRK